MPLFYFKKKRIANIIDIIEVKIPFGFYIIVVKSDRFHIKLYQVKCGGVL